MVSHVSLTLPELPEVEVQHGVDQHSRFGLDQDSREHCNVHEHTALQEQMQRPLRAIIVVPANCPRLRLGLDQRLECVPYRRLLAMPALPYPRRVDMLGHVVCVRVGEEPGNEGGRHSREYESSRTRQCASCNACKGRVMVARPRFADGSNRVYVSGDEKEYGDCAATADGESEEWQLEEVRCDFGVVGW
jgi:hypothetical protein